MACPLWYVGALGGELAERTRLLREQGAAGSNPVIPTSIYKRAASPGSLFFFVLRAYSGPKHFPIDNEMSHGM